MLLRPACPGGKKIHEGCHRSKPRNQGHSTRVSHPASSEAPARQDRTRLTSLEGCGHPVVVGIGHADVAFTMKQYVQTGLEADRRLASTLAQRRLADQRYERIASSWLPPNLPCLGTSRPSVGASDPDDLKVGHGVIAGVLRHDRNAVSDRGSPLRPGSRPGEFTGARSRTREDCGQVSRDERRTVAPMRDTTLGGPDVR